MEDGNESDGGQNIDKGWRMEVGVMEVVGNGIRKT